VEGALKEALAMKDRMVFMDFITDQTENVYPMFSAGKPHNEMTLGPCAAVVDPDRELA
jgi:acetolactate synthase-1/2/3 large subunit